MTHTPECLARKASGKGGCWCDLIAASMPNAPQPPGPCQHCGQTGLPVTSGRRGTACENVVACNRRVNRQHAREYQGVHPGSGAPRDTSYNGWTNRATWQAGLWLDNEEPLYRDMQAFARKGNVTAETTKAWFVTVILGRVGDEIKLADVNWQEIVDDCVLPSIDREA